MKNKWKSILLKIALFQSDTIYQVLYFCTTPSFILYDRAWSKSNEQTKQQWEQQEKENDEMAKSLRAQNFSIF